MKPSIENYGHWFEENFNIDLNSRPATVYKYVIQKLQTDVEDSSLWRNLQSDLADYNDEYYLKNGYPLLRIESIPLYTKSYDSVLNKSFRKNVLLNEKFPDEPLEGWITPENWFQKIKDLLRTTITVRYLDGVEFITNKIKELAEKHDFSFHVDFEAREEGYYAAHITICGKFNIVNENWQAIEMEIPIEIQITTQLQEVIKGLLHKMYEEVRILPNEINNQKWQWDYKSKEFSSNYLGHILHYVEGMILEVRDKQNLK